MVSRPDQHVCATSVDLAKIQRGTFTYPADSAVLLLNCQLEVQPLPIVLRRETVITSLAGAPAQLQRESLIDEKKRQIWACPRYNICCDLVFPDRSKINQADQLYWEQRNVDQILVLARPCLRLLSGDCSSTSMHLIYCAKHRFISETAGCIQCFTVSHISPSPHPPPAGHTFAIFNIWCVKKEKLFLVLEFIVTLHSRFSSQNEWM